MKLRRNLSRFPLVRRATLTLRFGDPRRTEPLSAWGTRRGTPVDRWYIDRYLRGEASAVTGRVLEVKSDTYASLLGAAEVEVVDIDPRNARAHVVADLCVASALEAGRYDAAVVTQTLQFVDDPAAAVRGLLRSLRPGGELLLTVPCLSRVADRTDRWRWTPVGFQQLLESTTPPGATVRSVGLGNGLAARAFLFGLAAEDLPPSALAVDDDGCPLVVGARVRLDDGSAGR